MIRHLLKSKIHRATATRSERGSGLVFVNAANRATEIKHKVAAQAAAT
jgi:aspartate 1-decarboxylase